MYCFRTIFDVDIDSIEEKPWKYPGSDATDYFNFGMDEDSWKDYCKQLVSGSFVVDNISYRLKLRSENTLFVQERLRMESTMKNKAYVHVVGSHPEQVICYLYI